MKVMLEQLKLKGPMVRFFKEELQVEVLAFALGTRILKKSWGSPNTTRLERLNLITSF